MTSTAQTVAEPCSWSRSQPWRQGSVLRGEDAIALGLLDSNSSLHSIAIVITHDCDCVSDVSSDPNLEVIIGCEAVGDGNFYYAKNVRRLHLDISSTGQTFEFLISSRKFLSKASVADRVPSDSVVLTPAEKQRLSRWLAARYHRAALHESLAHRFSKMESFIEKAAKRGDNLILGIYLWYEPEEEILSEDTPYELSIAVVYPHDIEGADKRAQETAVYLQDKFERQYKVLRLEVGQMWSLIELRTCEALSDLEFTLYDTQTYRLLRLEYLSLRSSDPDEIPLS